MCPIVFRKLLLSQLTRTISPNISSSDQSIPCNHITVALNSRHLPFSEIILFTLLVWSCIVCLISPESKLHNMSYPSSVCPPSRTVPGTQPVPDKGCSLTVVSNDAYLRELLVRLNLSVCVKHLDDYLAHNRKDLNKCQLL